MHWLIPHWAQVVVVVFVVIALVLALGNFKQ